VFQLHFTPNLRRWLTAGERSRASTRASSSSAVLEPIRLDGLGPDLTSPPADDHASSFVYQGSRPPMAAADWRALGYSETEATRLMKTCVPAATRVSVVVLSSDGVAPLAHYPFHSPTGFEWGFSGSGPADLARCILLHHLGVTPSSRGEFYPPAPDELPVRYQAFKSEVIARLAPDEPWALSSQQISTWIEAHR
jgi:hypothetical protein